MTQRAALGERDREILTAAMSRAEKAQRDLEHYRRTVVQMIGKSSYREVARLTGLSTNTLQRWKREAQR